MNEVVMQTPRRETVLPRVAPHPIGFNRDRAAFFEYISQSTGFSNAVDPRSLRVIARGS
jgi:hypothetical protein